MTESWWNLVGVLFALVFLILSQLQKAAAKRKEAEQAPEPAPDGAVEARLPEEEATSSEDLVPDGIWEEILGGESGAESVPPPGRSTAPAPPEYSSPSAPGRPASRPSAYAPPSAPERSRHGPPAPGRPGSRPAAYSPPSAPERSRYPDPSGAGPPARSTAGAPRSSSPGSVPRSARTPAPSDPWEVELTRSRRATLRPATPSPKEVDRSWTPTRVRKGVQIDLGSLSRRELRRAVVLREVLGRPLALRE